MYNYVQKQQRMPHGTQTAWEKTTSFRISNFARDVFHYILSSLAAAAGGLGRGSIVGRKHSLSDTLCLILSGSVSLLTLRLARALDSLVSVSRRVEWIAEIAPDTWSLLLGPVPALATIFELL